MSWPADADLVSGVTSASIRAWTFASLLSSAMNSVALSILALLALMTKPVATPMTLSWLPAASGICRQVDVIEVEVGCLVDRPADQPRPDRMHGRLALEEELGALVVVDGIRALVDAFVVGQLGDVAECLLPLGGRELAGPAEGLAAYASSPTTREAMCDSQLPAAHRSLLPDAIGVMPAAFSVSHAARSSSQVVGGWTPASARSFLLYQRTLVTSAEYGTMTVFPSTVYCDRVGVVEQARECAIVGKGRGDVRGEAVLDSLLEPAARPLEVDVRCVPSAQQVLQSDRLVEIVVLVVQLDRRAGVGRLELLRDVIPDADLRLAG